MHTSVRSVAGGVALAALAAGAVACSDSTSNDAAPDGAPVDLVVEAQDTPAVQVTTNGQHVGIETNGVGTVEVEPDVADIRLGVSVIRPSADEANADAADKTAIVFAGLEIFEIDEADIQTTNYRIDPVWDDDRIVGYRVTNDLTVRIRDLDSIGALIDATTAFVGDEMRISGITFSLEDNTEAIEAARDLAMADATARAEQLAAAADAEIGPVVSIRESSPENFDILLEADAAADFAGASRSNITQIAGGEVGTTVHVTVRWEVG